MSLDAKREKTKQTYDAIWQLYRDDYGKDYDHFEIVDRLISAIAGRNLTALPHADLGSGPGNVVDYLLEKGLNRIDAVDFSDAFADYLAGKYSGDGRVRVIRGDMVSYVGALPASSVSSVTASYSVIHIPDGEVDGLFAGITRALVPGGVFVMSCHKGTRKDFAAEPYQTGGDTRLTVREPLTSYLNCFTEAELERRLTAAGLHVRLARTYFVPPAANDFAAEKIWVLSEKRS
jgi:SAM-dependent methyltransferase